VIGSLLGDLAAERIDVERDDSRMFDLSTSELIQASAENFLAIYGTEPVRAFWQVFGKLLNPPPVKALSTKKSATSMRKRRAREKAMTTGSVAPPIIINDERPIGPVVI
jgi:hypothetical protein